MSPYSGVTGQLKTALANLTTIIGKLVASVDVNSSTLAPASTALSNTVWDDALKTTIQGRAAESPALLPPKASGIELPSASALSTSSAAALAANCGGQLHTNGTSTLSDALNYTGSGVLNFLAVGNVNAFGSQIVLTIDGATVLTTTGTGASGFFVIAGSLGSDAGVPAGLDQIPFKTSIRIQHAFPAAGGGTSNCVYRVRKVS